MHPHNVAILKSLVSVAWADGDFGAPEKEMLDALLVAFDADEQQSQDLRTYAGSKRTLDDIPVFREARSEPAAGACCAPRGQPAGSAANGACC